MTEPTFEEREARRKLFTEIRPSASKEYYSGKAFEDDFRSAHVVRTDAIPDVQKKLRLFFCPCCQKQIPNTDLSEVHVAYAQYDEDPLRNYAALVTLRCFGCGWNEIIPVSNPPEFTAEQQQALLEIDMASKQRELARIRGMQGLMNPNIAAGDALRAYQQNSVFGQMFEAGPQVMKNLLDITPEQLMNIRTPEVVRPRSGQALADIVWAGWVVRDAALQALEQHKRDLEATAFRSEYEAELKRSMSEALKQNFDNALIPSTKPTGTQKINPRVKFGNPVSDGILDKLKKFFK